MIRVRQVKIPVSNNPDILAGVAKKLKIKSSEIKEYKIHKMSIDARRKPNLFYVYEIDVDINNEGEYLKNNKDIDVLKAPIEKYEFKISGNKELNNRP